MRTLVKAAVVVTVVAALGFSGLALAQTSTDWGEPGSAPIDHLIEKLQPLVEGGTLTPDQAEAVAAFVADHPRTPERPRRFAVATHLLRHAADFLDITGAELREEIAGGDTIARVAGANGSSGDSLVEYLVEDAEDHLAHAVERGRIDEERAAELLEEAEVRITELVFDTPQPSRGCSGGA